MAASKSAGVESEPDASGSGVDTDSTPRPDRDISGTQYMSGALALTGSLGGVNSELAV